MKLQDLIDQILSRQEASLSSGKFRVSGAGQCYLKRIVEKEGYEPSDPYEPRKLRIFAVGNIFHNWLQDLLEKEGILIGKEIEVEDEVKKGHIDAIIQLDGKRILYDFKTVHSHKFFHLSNGIDIHYCIQAWTYKQMYEAQFQEKIDEVYIIYISKDDLLFEEIDVSKVYNIEKITKEDWEILLKIYKKEEEFHGPKWDWECQYCIYKSICKEIAKKEGYIK